MIRRFLKSAVDSHPGAAQFLRNGREFLDRNQPLQQTPWGFALAGHPQMASGAFEPDETRFFRALLQSADVFVNVGANIGYYCCHALSMGKPVLAVEPNSRNLYYLLKNIASNGWSEQAEVFPIALGDKTDILPMWGGGTGASLVKGWAKNAESHVNRVPLLSLDRILGDTLRGKRALVLIDVEGFEFSVLKGAINTLKMNPKPVWMVEIEWSAHQPTGVSFNPNFEATFGAFFDADYSCEMVVSPPVKISREDVREVVMGRSSFAKSNFVFR